MNAQQKIFLSKVENHKGILIKVSRMYMDTAEDREDLEQEIIYQLWKSNDRFQENSSFSSWMYRIAINTAITYLKKNKKRLDNHNYDTPPEAIAESYDNDKESQLEYFYKAVRQLNKVEKALILLFIDGMPSKEIANTIGLSEVNTRVKLNRTKNKIKKLVKNQGYEF